MKVKLLIVDDENSIRDALARHFKLEGFDVDTSENGVEALKKLAAEPYSVVVSDIQMPVMDGIELLHKIRADYPMTRVIMMTGYVTLNNALACMRYGADTCIFKPIKDLEELDTAVNRAVENLNHWQKKFLDLKGMKP